MKDKIIIGLIGEKGGGKDTIAAYLIEHYGAYMLGVGDLLRQIHQLLELEYTRESMNTLVKAIREQFGEEILQTAILKKFANVPNKICVISGVRKPAEIEQLHAIGGKIWYITAPIEQRFERIFQRRQNADDAHQTLELFKQQEHLPAEIYITELGQRADVTIHNTGTLEELLTKVDQEMIGFSS